MVRDPQGSPSDTSGLSQYLYILVRCKKPGGLGSPSEGTVTLKSLIKSVSLLGFRGPQAIRSLAGS
jgi:hypothetical protein